MANAIHILAIPLPAIGHINPMLHLCERLIELAGFEVTILIPESVLPSLNQTAKSKTRTRMVALPDGFSSQQNIESPSTSVMDAIERLMNSAIGLRSAAEEFVRDFYESGKLSCILSDAFVPWTHELSTLINVPVAILSTHAVTTDLVLIHGRKLKEQGYFPANLRKPGDEPEVIDFIPGVPPGHPDDILPLSLGEDHPWVDYVIGAFELMLEAKWILSSSFEAMEPEQIKTLHEHYGFEQFLAVGPLISHDHNTGGMKQLKQVSDDEASCLKWLDSQEQGSVIYISHGSLAILSSSQLMELAHGLEATGYKFLLVMRPSLVVDQPGTEFFERFQEQIKPRGHFVSWAPQLEVLNHPAVAMFVTHCGWNSTMEAISAGVPMIAWPCLAEQNINCKLIEERGLGLRIYRPSLSATVDRKHIAEAIRSIASSPTFRENVQKLREELKKGLSPGGSSYKNLESFYRSILD